MRQRSHLVDVTTFLQSSSTCPGLSCSLGASKIHKVQLTGHDLLPFILLLRHCLVVRDPVAALDPQTEDSVGPGTPLVHVGGANFPGFLPLFHVPGREISFKSENSRTEGSFIIH